jgi:hypothetical protein
LPLSGIPSLGLVSGIPSSASLSCLAVKSTGLAKRAFVSFDQIPGYQFSCTTDQDGNPFQDCLNSIAVFCNKEYLGSDGEKKKTCRNVVDQSADVSNSYWKAFRRDCGQWESQFSDLKGVGGSNAYASSACETATANLLANGYFYDSKYDMKVPLSKAVTDSITSALWSNSNLS